MISSWRRRRAAKQQNLVENASMELTIPIHFRCPISLDLMKDPVTLSTGTTYDRESIETWLEAGSTSCPITNQQLRSLDLVPNHTIRKMIQDWCVENKSSGVERIPTPKIPISSHQVLNILSQLDDANLGNDLDKSKELVSKIMALARESERNKRCIIANGAGKVLSAMFNAFSRRDFGNNDNYDLLKEILSILVIIISPFDEETRRNLSTSSSLEKIVWFLRFGSLSRRGNAVLVLREVVSKDEDKVGHLAKIEGVLEALVKLIKEPICPTATKASLLVMYHMVISSSDIKKVIIKSFGEMGLVQMLVEMVVDSDRSVCEKALGVLDGIFSHSEGREKGYENALIIPLLVKKLLRVSDLATDFSVSIIWKLGKNEEKMEDGGVIVEALKVGAFQKLLLLLQVGCNEVTKHKVTELLKLLNEYRNKVEECIDSLDFKNLKRPF
ncbi:hypothetical protein BUALT_Bualt11G0044900 [Buddleja alternifolia]|uniref:U-box domain-containing protein n=1 Tax=Buddleja alternifolia TaxID=168488 RepID=A0AAV6WZS4_9LAMI|nr:hypothetical protein BUALT_Bualt11G0044900 [Buddleja alternifolia]